MVKYLIENKENELCYVYLNYDNSLIEEALTLIELLVSYMPNLCYLKSVLFYLSLKTKLKYSASLQMDHVLRIFPSSNIVTICYFFHLIDLKIVLRLLQV